MFKSLYQLTCFIQLHPSFLIYSLHSSFYLYESNPASSITIRVKIESSSVVLLFATKNATMYLIIEISPPTANAYDFYLATTFKQNVSKFQGIPRTSFEVHIIFTIMENSEFPLLIKHTRKCTSGIWTLLYRD